MKLNALYPVLGTERLSASRDFYAQLLDLRVTFENEWYVSLATRSEPTQQIAFVSHDHESVPRGDRKLPAGVLVTLETDDVDAIYERARAGEHELVLAIRDEPWGQRHFIVRDPNGVLVDVTRLIAPSAEYAGAYTTT